MSDLSAGMSLLSAGSSYMAAKQQNEFAQKWQTYSNAMVNIQNGQNQNSISNNEQVAVTEAVNTDINIQKSALILGAKQQVQAAAAGVQGRSVNQSLMAIQAQASEARSNNQTNLTNQLNSYASQREQGNMTTAMEQKNSYLPTPQIANYLLPTLGKMTDNMQSDPSKYQTGSNSNSDMNAVSFQFGNINY
ncbi:MAG TPA: hypothetical protein VNZ45_16790 [Bacteroidia bacterium]|nr:hypothetical protein [Bacteroidia bacterium]